MFLTRMLERLRHYRHVLGEDMTLAAIARYSRFQMLIGTLEQHIGDGIKGKTILDIGCGRLYPYTLLLQSIGNTVTGIDVAYVRTSDPLIKAISKALRSEGLQGLGSVLLLQTLKRGAFFRALQSLCDFPLTARPVDIRQMSVENLAFSEQTFDIAVSFAVFEHLPDVPRAVAEIERVLKRAGIAYIEIHLFASLSGGHHPDYAEPQRVPPWDHLRQRKRPLPGYLNKLREDDYISVFRARFDILEIRREKEEKAESFLTQTIRAELSSYSEDELLTKAIVIVARKRD